MCWKKLPTWLKGGIIVGIIPLIIYLIFLIFIDSIDEGTYIITCATIFFCEIISYKRDTFVFTGIFAVIVWFIIGAIIGLIVSKIKQRKNQVLVKTK